MTAISSDCGHLLRNRFVGPQLRAWDVVPIKSKIQVLHFHVTIRLKIEGTEEKRDYPVIDKEVYVKVNPVYSTKVFAVNNWKWILTALIIPLVGWIIKNYLSKN